MSMSRRARRMERHYNKSKTPALNLVSLMDIFTILVFFLLVSSSNTQQLPSHKDLKLPTSTSKSVPGETLVIAITKSDILLKGQSVAKVAEVMGSASADIPALKNQLLALSKRNMPIGNTFEADTKPDAGSPITIMGDESISYDLIRKILNTCQQANFTKIAFAAVQSAK